MTKRTWLLLQVMLLAMNFVSMAMIEHTKDQVERIIRRGCTVDLYAVQR